MQPDYIPTDYEGIRVVNSLAALFNTPFGPANAILFPRTLRGDFNALARQLNQIPFDVFNPDFLNGGFRDEKEQILVDSNSVRTEMIQRGIDPSRYQLRVEDPIEVEDPTTCCFHKDSGSLDDFGRILCCYNDPVTEWIKNEDAVPKIYSIYEMKKGAIVHSFRAGDIWRQYSPNIYTPGQRGLHPFIHRVPRKIISDKQPDNPPRMLLVAG